MIATADTFKGVYKHLIFDFDGTINNTEPGITIIFKKVLSIYNIDTSKIDFKKHIGPPLEYSFQELVGGEKWQEALALYRKTFVEENAVKLCELYDGIVETIEKLHGKFNLTIATSKYEPFAIESAKNLKIDKYFSAIFGQTETRGFKDEILHQLITEHGFKKEDCLMIGDTHYDIEGARKNGIDVLAVSYGFETKENLMKLKPDAIVDTPAEIAELILQKR